MVRGISVWLPFFRVTLVAKSVSLYCFQGFCNSVGTRRSFWEKTASNTPLLYFWSSKQNGAIWPTKSLAVAEYLCYCKGFTFAYKPLFNCWNSPQVTVLRSVRNSGFRASMSRGKKRHFQVSLRKETNTLKRTEHTNTLHCRKKAFTERLPVMIEISLFQLKIRNTRLHIWEICVTTQQIWSLG